MRSASLIRSLRWPVVLVAIVVSATSAALLVRQATIARAAPPVRAPTVNEGVVCFGTVDLEHGVTSLSPLQPGRVVEVLVRENQVVSEGTELLRLDDKGARSRLAEAEAALEVVRLQLQQAQKLPEQHRRRVDQQDSILRALRSRLATARQLLARRQKLAQQPNAIAAVDVAASEMQVREFEGEEQAQAHRLAEFQSQDMASDIHRAEYELTMSEERLVQARLALNECRIKAPKSGTILRILLGPGDVLAGDRGQPALLFAADGPQVIRATVEQEFAPRIHEGQAVLVQDESNANMTWRGRVERMADWYSQRRAMLHDPSQMSDVRTLECVISLETGQPRLRLGQGVRVFVGVTPPGEANSSRSSPG